MLAPTCARVTWVSGDGVGHSGNLHIQVKMSKRDNDFRTEETLLLLANSSKIGGKTRTSSTRTRSTTKTFSGSRWITKIEAEWRFIGTSSGKTTYRVKIRILLRVLQIYYYIVEMLEPAKFALIA